MHYDLGVFQMETKQQEEAAASFSTAIKLEPLHYDAMVNLGSVLRNLDGRTDEALGAYKQAIRIRKRVNVKGK